MLAPNTLLQNRYLIVRSIGHGGMGAVYLARDERLGNTVALKETFFSEERMRKAFEREARLLAHLRHPALPKVTDHFEEEGGQFIVMEFIKGDDLEMLLTERAKPFPFEQVLVWGDELLKALDYLHAQDPPILHRDIKPANLKLTPQGEIILLDFGLAKGTAGQTSSVMTSRSLFGFTPNFAPLEQIQGTGTGPRSDLYSLAATLYYLMTGVIPPDALTRITEVANGQPDPLRRPDEINPQIPQPVADILMKTMAHNRDQRPASASLMRSMLRAACPAIAGAFEANGNGARVGLEDKATILPSTLIEALPTKETPTAQEPAPASIVASTVKPSDSSVETSPAQDVALATSAKSEQKAMRLSLVFAGFIVLILIGVAIAYVSNSDGEKLSTSKSQQTAAKDESLTTAPTINAAQQTTPAPDDSEIATTTDASGVKTETRTFRSNTRISRVVRITRDGKQTAKIYSNAGEERDLPDDKVADALTSSGDSLADAVGFVSSEKGATQQQAASKKAPVQRPVKNTKPAGAKTTPSNQTGSIPMNQGINTQPVEQKPTQTKDAQDKINRNMIKQASQPRAKF